MPQQPPAPAETLSAQVSSNIKSIAAFHEREHDKLGESERRFDFVGNLMGRPLYLAAVFSLVAIWVGANSIARMLGRVPFDPPPFSALQRRTDTAQVLEAVENVGAEHAAVDP